MGCGYFTGPVVFVVFDSPTGFGSHQTMLSGFLMRSVTIEGQDEKKKPSPLTEAYPQSKAMQDFCLPDSGPRELEIAEFTSRLAVIRVG